MYFPVNFAKFLRTPFLQNTSRRHLVLHHCVECITFAAECVSKVFIDIRMSIICGVPQKVKRRKVHKQDKREDAKMASKKEKDSHAKKEWTDVEISLLIDMLEANPCLWEVYHFDYTNRGIKEINRDPDIIG